MWNSDIWTPARIAIFSKREKRLIEQRRLMPSSVKTTCMSVSDFGLAKPTERLIKAWILFEASITDWLSVVSVVARLYSSESQGSVTHLTLPYLPTLSAP